MQGLVPGFRDVMMTYHRACIGCTLRINRLIALALDLPATFFDKDFVNIMALVRPLHYAPVTSLPDEVRLCAANILCVHRF